MGSPTVNVCQKYDVSVLGMTWHQRTLIVVVVVVKRTCDVTHVTRRDKFTNSAFTISHALLSDKIHVA